MDAQAAALANISDNVANSQTVGFKETDTAFEDYVTTSTATFHSPGAVIALPEYTNTVQGTVTQVSDPTAIAISGNGFLPVQLPTSSTTFSPQQYYTRAGDFTTNVNGYLVNSSGYVLDGWPATNATGTTFNTTTLAPIQISQAPSPPVPTTAITLAANLPSTPATGTTPYTSSMQINDASGATQTVDMTWTQVTAAGPVSASNAVSATNPVLANQWDLTLSSGSSYTGPMRVTFGTTPATAGMITGIATDPQATTVAGNDLTAAQATLTAANTAESASPSAANAAAVAAATTAVTNATTAQTNVAAGEAAATTAVPANQNYGDPATVNLALNFGYGIQNVGLNLGEFQTANGVTQFSGTSFEVASQSQNGSAQGNFESVTIQATGNVVINYDNGSTKTIAQVPLANFASPDSLQQQDGQAFSATIQSGPANIVTAGTEGTSSMVIGAVEGSNVDIATQFTQMIVAQRAYTANSKVITTADSMMQDALNMVQG
jgi:flagellar hook protein FlgE